MKLDRKLNKAYNAIAFSLAESPSGMTYTQITEKVNAVGCLSKTSRKSLLDWMRKHSDLVHVGPVMRESNGPAEYHLILKRLMKPDPGVVLEPQTYKIVDRQPKEPEESVRPLSEERIATLEPKEASYRVFDRVNEGNKFWLLVNPNGTKIWQYWYTYNGKQHTSTLGLYPAVSLTKAREKRDLKDMLIRQDINPAKSTRRQEYYGGVNLRDIRKAAAEIVPFTGRDYIRPGQMKQTLARGSVDDINLDPVKHGLQHCYNSADVLAVKHIDSPDQQSIIRPAGYPSIPTAVPPGIRVSNYTYGLSDEKARIQEIIEAHSDDEPTGKEIGTWTSLADAMDSVPPKVGTPDYLRWQAQQLLLKADQVEFLNGLDELQAEYKVAMDKALTDMITLSETLNQLHTVGNQILNLKYPTE